LSDTDVFRLSLAVEEVEWVLYQIQSPGVRLYADPFVGHSVDDIELALQNACGALTDRGWIKAQPDGSIVLDVTVAGVVGVLGFADVGLWVTLFRGQDPRPQIRRYFAVEGLLVEQGTDDIGEIRIIALRDVDVLQAHLLADLGIKDQQAPTERALTCVEEGFSDIPYILAGDGEADATLRLVELGAEERWAGEFIAAMDSPLWQATLQLVTLDSDRPEGVRLLGKLTLIEGIYGLWAVITDLESTPTRVNVVPCDAAQARSYVGQLVDMLVS